MSEDMKKEEVAESGDPLTDEELQAVVGGTNTINLNPNDPSDDNPSPPAPDPPAFPGHFGDH